MRLAILNLTLQPVWEGLTEHKWSNAQLVALDAELAKLNFLADYKSGMRAELGCQDGIFDYLPLSRIRCFFFCNCHIPEQIPALSGNGSPVKQSPMARILWHLIPTGWFYQNRLSCARPMVELFIPLADTNRATVSPKATLQADAAVQAEIRHRSRYNAAERLFLSGLGNSAKKFAYGQASVDLARVAIALERYRLAQGEYPRSLDALEPLPKACVLRKKNNYRATVSAPI